MTMNKAFSIQAKQTSTVIPRIYFIVLSLSASVFSHAISAQTNEKAVVDFSGVWMAIAVDNPAGGGKTPEFSDEGEAALDVFTAQFSEVPEAGGACVGTGLPGVMLSLVSYPIEITQNDSRILMVAELETQVRRIFIDDREHPNNVFPTSVGHSSGKWDGETLVVDTTLLEEWPLRPWPRSENARIRERLYLTKMENVSVSRSGFLEGVQPPLNDDVLVVDISIEDSTYYANEQRRIAYYQRMDDYATSEYACSRGLWYDSLEEFRLE